MQRAVVGALDLRLYRSSRRDDDVALGGHFGDVGQDSRQIIEDLNNPTRDRGVSTPICLMKRDDTSHQGAYQRRMTRPDPQIPKGTWDNDAGCSTLVFYTRLGDNLNS